MPPPWAIFQKHHAAFGGANARIIPPTSYYNHDDIMDVVEMRFDRFCFGLIASLTSGLIVQ